jgi:hypothetical protein
MFFYACNIIQTWLRLFSVPSGLTARQFKEFKENEEAETSAQTGARHSD